MKFKEKVPFWMAIGIAVYLVHQTGSERLMKGYNFTGPNKGPVLRKESDQSRETLYYMAGASALGLLFRKDKKGER